MQCQQYSMVRHALNEKFKKLVTSNTLLSQNDRTIIWYIRSIKRWYTIIYAKLYNYWKALHNYWKALYNYWKALHHYCKSFDVLFQSKSKRTHLGEYILLPAWMNLFWHTVRLSNAVRDQLLRDRQTPFGHVGLKPTQVDIDTSRYRYRPHS